MNSQFKTNMHKYIIKILNLINDNFFVNKFYLIFIILTYTCEHSIIFK